MMGKKAISKELIDIADMYIDSCEDEFHMDTFVKGKMLVELAKVYLIQQKSKPRGGKPRA